MVFTLKVRCVYDGHRTLDSDISLYVRVVSRDSIGKILNEVDLRTTDIRDAYIKAPTSEKQK